MTRDWMLSPGLPLALAALGTLSLTFAWLRENDELARAKSNMDRLQRSQLVIDIDQIARDQWIIALNQERAKPKPDEELLATEAYGALQGFATWQSHMETRVANSSEESKAELAARDAILANAKKLAAANDYKGVMRLLFQLGQMSHNTNSTAKLDERFFASVDTARGRVADLEYDIRLWYVLGTGLLLLSSIFASVLLEISLKRLEKHQQVAVPAPVKQKKAR
jgi:hypothetical protein